MQPIIAGGPGGQRSITNRIEFIRATYTHLAVAMLAFVVLSGFVKMTGLGVSMLNALSGSRLGWLAVMGGFMAASWLAMHLTDNGASNQKQRLGLGLYVIAEVLIFAPMFALADIVAPNAVLAAGFVTLVLVGGLTWTAFTTKTNFSFMGSFLKIAGLVALGTIVASVIFSFQLGIWFSGLMVLFAGGCVLFDTSKIIHDYPIDRPAGAALHLFASIAMLFWYVLRILMSLSSRD
jgi:uncharacterized protein